MIEATRDSQVLVELEDMNDLVDVGESKRVDISCSNCSHVWGRSAKVEPTNLRVSLFQNPALAVEHFIEIHGGHSHSMTGGFSAD